MIKTNQKQTAIFDMDGVFINTNKAVCDYYNDHYNQCKSFIPANPNKVYYWSLKSQLPIMTKDEIVDIFNYPILFAKYMELNKNAEVVLKELKKYYYIKLYTIGTSLNISNKNQWLYKTGYENLFDELIFKNNKILTMNKGDFNMKNSILIDDNQDNLFSSNADRKICFAPHETEYNKDWIGEKVKSMEELYLLLMKEKILFN